MSESRLSIEPFQNLTDSSRRITRSVSRPKPSCTVSRPPDGYALKPDVSSTKVDSRDSVSQVESPTGRIPSETRDVASVESRPSTPGRSRLRVRHSVVVRMEASVLFATCFY